MSRIYFPENVSVCMKNGIIYNNNEVYEILEMEDLGSRREVWGCRKSKEEYLRKYGHFQRMDKGRSPKVLKNEKGIQIKVGSLFWSGRI